MSTEAILRNLIISKNKAVSAKLKKQKVPASIIRTMSGTELQDSGIYQTHVLPVDCFPLEFILGQTGIPLHRILTLQGTTASAKSSMFWFMARIFLQNGGFVLYFDLENKHEPRTAQAYIGNPIAYHNRVHVYPSSIIECAAVQMASILDSIAADKDLRKRPILLGVDTLGSALSAKSISDMKQGKADPGYTMAKGTLIQQKALQYAISQHMPNMPLTIVGLQQERSVMDNPDEIRATGGKFSGFAKSVALRMEKFANWKNSRGEKLPLIRMSQEKNSSNTQRSFNLTLPCFVSNSGLPFRNYSFQWHYAMMQLLAEMSESAVSCMDGVFRVEKKDKAFIVKGKKSTASEWLQRYETGACSYNECGPPILADAGLRDVLRRNTDLNIEPVFESPYRVPISLQGGLWLGPEEDENWNKMSEAEVLEKHRQAITRYAEEVEEEKKNRAKAKDEDEDENDGTETEEDDNELEL